MGFVGEGMQEPSCAMRMFLCQMYGVRVFEPCLDFRKNRSRSSAREWEHQRFHQAVQKTALKVVLDGQLDSRTLPDLCKAICA